MTCAMSIEAAHDENIRIVMVSIGMVLSIANYTRVVGSAFEED